MSNRMHPDVLLTADPTAPPVDPLRDALAREADARAECERLRGRVVEFEQRRCETCEHYADDMCKHLVSMVGCCRGDTRHDFEVPRPDWYCADYAARALLGGAGKEDGET